MSHDPALEPAGAVRELERDAADAGADRPTTPQQAFTLAAVGQPVALAQHFDFPEGPAWSVSEQVLYFTDIGANIVYRYAPSGTLGVALTEAGHPDGLAISDDGFLFGAGFGDRNVWKLVEGRRQVLASEYDGHALNSPDDIAVRWDGIVYFTDPTYGIDGSTAGLPRVRSDLGFQGVYRIDAQGGVHLEDQSVSSPNGIRLSADQSTLYVSSTTRGAIYAYTVEQDGSLSDRRTLSTSVSGADSFCLDELGNLYVASTAGITVLDPDGAKLGTIAVPGLTSNAAFGGADRRTLFITTRGVLGSGGTQTGRIYHIDHMPVAGLIRGTAP
jgi:gluconolactonase